MHWQGAGLHVSQPDPPKKQSWADVQHDEGGDEDEEDADEKAAADAAGAADTKKAASSADEIMAKLGKPTGRKPCTDGGVVA